MAKLHCNLRANWTGKICVEMTFSCWPKKFLPIYPADAFTCDHGSEGLNHDAQSTASRDLGTVGRLAPAGAAARLDGGLGVAEHGLALAAVAERPLHGNALALPGGVSVPGADPLRTACHPTRLSSRLPH